MGYHIPSDHHGSTPSEPRFNSIQKCAQAAIDMQDACNLSGVLMSWAEMRPTVWKLAAREGTTAFNEHPINVLMAYKVYVLTHGAYPDQPYVNGTTAFEDAYRACKTLAEHPAAIDPGFQAQMNKLIGG